MKAGKNFRWRRQRFTRLQRVSGGNSGRQWMVFEPSRLYQAELLESRDLHQILPLPARTAYHLEIIRGGKRIEYLVGSSSQSSARGLTRARFGGQADRGDRLPTRLVKFTKISSQAHKL
ncbi:Hypothetical predicted protein [Olea europaea subsp. europaea]|uniref:Uncharacterized protein n=1 Tax=Olea europaea subsp. europaea TaxID=158383 RepID=A0A8S0UBE9_OLEEU|nr:Hypothetical predicted protein [Olea europaea subsp. europaea]